MNRWLQIDMFVIAVLVALGLGMFLIGCAYTTRDDGLGDIYKGVRELDHAGKL